VEAAAVPLVLVQTELLAALVVAPDQTMFRQQVVLAHLDRETTEAAIPLFSMPDLVAVVLALLVLALQASTVQRRVALLATAETDRHSHRIAHHTLVAVVAEISTTLAYLVLVELAGVVMENADRLV
jgi:hypothetical protein